MEPTVRPIRPIVGSPIKVHVDSVIFYAYLKHSQSKRFQASSDCLGVLPLRLRQIRLLLAYTLLPSHQAQYLFE